MKKNLTMQLMPLWLLAFFFFASVPIKAQVKGFAGVTKLIGCGSGANANKAEVSITNVTGGTAPYQYQFNGGAWQPSNVGWLAQGTHNVRIKDNNGVMSSLMQVKVPAPSIAPVITKEIFYDCDGRPTLKVGVQNPQPSYRYLFKLDNAPTFSEKYLFQNVSTGTHTITVKYEDTTIPSPMMLLEETFGSGSKTSLPAGVTDLHYGGITVLEGDYEINNAAYINTISVVNLTCPGTGVWVPVPDHTSNGTDPQGRFFVTNAKTLTPDGDLIYKKKVKDISPNSEIRYEFYVLNLFQEDKKIHASGLDAIKPKFKVRLVDNLGNVISPEISTGEVPNSLCGAGMNNWHKYQGSLNSGSYTEFTIEFRSDGSSAHGWGNDYAIDDIKVWQMPQTCGQEVSTTVSVTTLQMPTISANLSNCSLSNNTLNLVVTPTSSLFTYQYQMDGGALQNSNVFTGLAMGSTHTFKVHYKPVASVVTLVNEDFGVGANPTANSYVNPEYYFESMNGATTIYNGKGDAKDNSAHIDRTVDGEYAISVNIPPSLAFLWHTPTDASGTTNGRKLIIDLSTPNPAFYMRPISVLPNKRLDFSAAIFNLLKTTAPNPCNIPGTQVRVRFYPNKAAFLANLTPIKSQSISLPLSATPSDWKYLTVSLSAAEVGANTSLYFVLDLSALGGCNDIAVDDIVVTQQLAECTKDFTTTINTSVTNAFAGVTKLIGCGASANANKAEVTIANVEGGSGTYEYSFDGITWTASNTSWLPAGTRTVSVRDAVTHGCPFDMSVTVPAALAQPTIKTEVFYACDGKAILNVGVANPDPELTYMYSLDGAAFTTTYVYTNVASGTHSVSVQYEHRSAPSPVMLLKETFGSGPKTDLPAGVTSFTYGTLFNEGEYEVNNYDSVKTLSPSHFGTGCASYNWVEIVDHTSGGTDSQGRVFMTNAKTHSSIGDLFYRKKVKDIVPNSEIKYEFYILNLFREDRKYFPGSSTSTNPPPGSPDDALKPNIKIRLVATDGTEIDVKTTGEIPNSICGAGLANWRKIEGTLNSGNNTEFTIEFRSNGANTHGWGDDFCIDDIIVYQVPNACGQVVSATKVVTANNQDIPAFTVSKTYDCATGKGALTVTPTATTGFTYTYTLGSTTYTSTTATFTGLDLEQTYTVSVSYQAVSNTITLLNEDFGVGTTLTHAVKSPYTAKNLYFNENINANYTAYNANGQSKALSGSGLYDGEYTISHNFLAGPFSSVWRTPNDHTGNTNGRIFFVNPPAGTLQTIYAREVNVLPNQALTFSAYFYNLIINPGNNPKVQLTVYKNKTDYENNSTPLKSFTSNEIPHNANNPNAWKQESVSLTATEVGARSSVYVVVSMVNPVSGGHDMAMDDIKVTQVIAPCTTSVTATLTKGDVATPTLTLPANLSVICSAPTASATISSWIASATATSTCGTATVTHNYVAPANLCNVTGGAVTVTFSTTDPFGNVVTATRVISFATMTLTVTPTTLSVPNGALGGTTSSVVPNITLGGVASPSTNSVTITFSGLPTGVTSTTGGRLIVAPNTPAGSHTITYTVCETAGHNNCKTVNTQLVIGTGSLTVTPTNLTHPNGTQGGTTTGTVLTGVKINGNPVNTASVTITWNTLPPNATGNASGTVTIAPNTPAGTYTISYTVCESLNGNSNCQSVTSQITVGGGSLTATPTTLTHPNGTQGGTTTGTVLTGVKINGNPVNTASVTITWNSLPPNATGNASGTVTIAPNTPAGTYTISYTVCERLNGNSNCQSVTSQITIGGGNMTVTPTQLIVANGATGGTSVNNVLTGVTINGNPVNTNSVTITWNSLPPGFTGTNSGTVTVPANTPAGIYTVTYTVCERLNSNSNCKTVSSTITVGNGSMIVVPTPITVPNGTIGGTSTPSVLTGVVLNGNSNPAPNTVSITWNTLPPRATGNNDGTVNVAPNTPAGTYTVSYTICEALNSGHCTTVTSTITIGGGVLTVTPVTTLTVANGAQGGTTTSSVLTGVSLNGQPANSQSVTITFSGLPAGVTSNTNGQLVVAPGTPATNTTIYYTVCETLNANNNCHTYSTTLVIGTPNLSVTPGTYAIPDATVGGTTSSVLETVTIDGHTPSSQSVTITFGNLPVGIQTTTSGGFRVPAGTPTGIHTVTYTVCEVLNPDHCVTSIATIAVGNVPVVTPNAFTYTGTATVTTPSILDDDTVGTQSATTGTGGNVVINITSTPTGTVVPSLDANNGRVTIPAGTPPGIYTITYDVCTTATPTACTPGAVVITIPNVPVITPDDMVYTDTTTTTAGNILTNDRVGTQSATAGNGGNVSITVTIPATPKAPGATVPTLNPNTGVVTVPAGTPSGTYTITYKICTTATPTSCDTGVVTITVSGTVTEAPDTNDVTAYTRINTPVTVGVTSSTTVTVSIPSQPANGTAVSNGDGTITYTPNNGFKGTDSFEYSLCNAAGCRTATISVRVTSELIIYNGVSIGGSDKNNHFHIEGIENYPNNTVRIYNRWGVKVFEMSGYNNTTKAFKGVSDARATLEASDNLPQGTYYYIIEYVDEHNKTQTETGWLYLKKN